MGGAVGAGADIAAGVGDPPVHVLVGELTEEFRDYLNSWPSELWEARLLFKEPGLGTKAAGTSLATQRLNACSHGCHGVFSCLPGYGAVAALLPALSFSSSL